MQTFSALLNGLHGSSFETRTPKLNLNDILCASVHPFEHLTRKYVEVVSFQGDIYVPCTQGTDYQLISKGRKKNLKKIGSVRSELNVPSSKTVFSTPTSVCEQAIYYYNNPSKTETDLLRFADVNYRLQYFVDTFSRPFYFTQTNAYGSGTLSSDSVAIFRNKKKTVAFEDCSDASSLVKDVMSTRPGGHFRVPIFGDADRIASYDVSADVSKDTVKFSAFVPEHSIRAIGRKFNLGSCFLGLTCYFSRGAVQLNDYPRVTSPGYKHFFVHVDGEICYDGEQRFIDIGLRRGKWYSLSNRLIGYKLARVLEQGLLNLTEGYTKSCRPVNKPETLLELAV